MTVFAVARSRGSACSVRDREPIYSSERIVARHHGRAHTSGDAVITFERANVVHMGHLAFHRRHPVVDRAAGASMRNWMRVLEQVVNAHARDTVYIFGHAAEGLPVTGSSTELLQFRDYLGAVLAFVERHVAAGRSREEILAMRVPACRVRGVGLVRAAGARATPSAWPTTKLPPAPSPAAASPHGVIGMHARAH